MAKLSASSLIGTFSRHETMETAGPLGPGSRLIVTFDHLGKDRFGTDGTRNTQNIIFVGEPTGSRGNAVAKSRWLRIQCVNHVFALTLTLVRGTSDSTTPCSDDCERVLAFKAGR
jgi:hypothetical protein